MAAGCENLHGKSRLFSFRRQLPVLRTRNPQISTLPSFLRQHPILAASAFHRSFPPEMRHFPLKYTKYSYGKMSFSDAKSLAECSRRSMRYCLFLRQCECVVVSALALSFLRQHHKVGCCRMLSLLYRAIWKTQ